MLFTTKTEYGLKALEILAKNSNNQPISLTIIATKSGLSLSYLEQIFAKLKRAKLVKSIKGTDGGYLLRQPANKINLFEIILALEGNTAVNSCMAGVKSNCSGHCFTRKIWVKIQNDIELTLKKFKLSDLT